VKKKNEAMEEKGVIREELRSVRTELHADDQPASLSPVTCPPHPLTSYYFTPSPPKPPYVPNNF
jgi:hypothetical protein